MDGYKPTVSLRFVEREESLHTTADGCLLPHGVVRVVKRKILQQLWVSLYQGKPDEWRDVECVA